MSRSMRNRLPSRGSFLLVLALLLPAACSAIDEDQSRSGPLGRVHDLAPDRGSARIAVLTDLPPGSTTLSGERFRIFTAVGEDPFEDLEQLARADASGNFIIEGPMGSLKAPDPAAEVSAYHHLERLLDRFESLGFPCPGERINVILDFGLDEDGDGEPDDFLAGATDVLGSPGLLIGRWGGRSLAFDPDVIGHELTHLVTAADNPLDLTLGREGLNTAPGALNEGSADYFSCSFMGDPLVGEYTAAALGLPCLSRVDTGARFPDDATGSPHEDGRIWSGALWEIRALVGAAAVDRAVCRTLRQLHHGSALADAAGRLQAEIAAEAGPGKAAAAAAILRKRGLDRFSPIVPLDFDRPRELWLPGRDEEIWDDRYGRILDLGCCPSPLQLEAVVAPGADSVSIRIEPVGGEEELDLGQVRVLFRFGSPVEYRERDGKLDATADACLPAERILVVDRASVPSFGEGPLFISFLNSGEGDVRIEVTGRARSTR